MKTRFQLILTLTALVLVAGIRQTQAQGTTFTYQGRLADNGQPANGTYGMVFYLCDNPTSGGQLANLGIVSVPVTNGLFTVPLDFGAGMFPGADRWLEITVKTNGAATFTTLTPRQKLTPTPYAITASNLSGTLPTAQLSGQLVGAQIANGAVGTAQIDNTAVQARITGTAPAGQFITGIAANGSVTVAPDTTDWKLNGNNVTPGQFLGSTNNQAVTIKANGLQALQISPLANDATHSNMVNVAAGSPVNYIAPGVYGSVIAGGGASYYGSGIYTTTNGVAADLSFIGGGGGNFVGTNADLSVIGGGIYNSIGTYSSESFIGGGHNNTIDQGADGSFIGGGFYNFIENAAEVSVIVGGSGNHIRVGSWWATIVGGFGNHILTNAQYGFIGGGQVNTISNAINATIGGGEANLAAADNGTVGGGYFNRIGQNSFSATIGGGTNNTISGNATLSTISGGGGNTMEQYASVAMIGGGYLNRIEYNAFDSVIAGGLLNVVKTNAGYGVIGGGSQNSIQIPAYVSVIGGGYANTNAGQYAVIPGGDFNFVTNHSFAAGHRARALNNGTFVWADDTEADFSSTTNKQFAVRANNGVMIQATNTALDLRGGGAIRVAGAGIGSSTPAFVQRAVSTNTSAHITTIYHPLCDGDPNAILIVTQNYNPGQTGNVYNNHVIGVYYNGSHWTIFNQDLVAMPLNAAFNVLVIKP